MGVESYKHQFAKATLASWLRDGAVFDKDQTLGQVSWRVNRGPPHFGVWTEYPVCLDSQNRLVGVAPVWCEESDQYENAPPTYDDCIGMGHLPICIYDVAVQHKGLIAHVFEVVHKNYISETKLEYMKRVFETHPFHLHVISADWILSQVRRPDELRYTTNITVRSNRQ